MNSPVKLFKCDSISTNDHVRPSGSLYPNIVKVVWVTLIQIASFEFMQTNHTLFQSGKFLFQIVDSGSGANVCVFIDSQVTEKGKSLVNIEKAFSSVFVKMLCVNVEIQKVILPSVSQIFYQVETIVSSSSQTSGGTRVSYCYTLRRVMARMTPIFQMCSSSLNPHQHHQDHHLHCTFCTHPLVCQPGSQEHQRRNRLGNPWRNR